MKESVLNEISYKSETVHVRLSKQESDILNKLSKKHNTSQNNIVGMLVRVSNNGDKFNVSNDFLRLNNEKFKYDKINSKKEIIRNSQEGATLVAAKILIEVVRHLEDEICSFELIDSSILKIEDSKSNFKLNSIRPEEYPDIDLSVSGASLVVPGKDIQALVESTAFAASIKETRPILTAVSLEAGEFKLSATATDTARLARKSVEIDSDAKFVANISAKKLLDIVRSFEPTDEVTIAVNETKAVFVFGKSIISTRLTNGDYPNTKNIVPRVTNYSLEVNATDLIKAIDRVNILSIDRENVVDLFKQDFQEKNVFSMDFVTNLMKTNFYIGK